MIKYQAGRIALYSIIEIGLCLIEAKDKEEWPPKIKFIVE